MGNGLCGFKFAPVLECADCGLVERPLECLGGGKPGEWRRSGSQVLCVTCAELRFSRKREERRKWRWKQEKLQTYGPAVKEPALKRIQSGREWCSSPSFKGSYHATMDAKLNNKVKVAQRRQDIAKAREWLDGQALSEGTEEAEESAAAAAEDGSPAGRQREEGASESQGTAAAEPATGECSQAAEGGGEAPTGEADGATPSSSPEAALGDESDGSKMAEAPEECSSPGRVSGMEKVADRKGKIDRDSASGYGGRRPRAIAVTYSECDVQATVIGSPPKPRPSIDLLLAAGAVQA